MDHVLVTEPVDSKTGTRVVIQAVSEVRDQVNYATSDTVVRAEVVTIAQNQTWQVFEDVTHRVREALDAIGGQGDTFTVRRELQFSAGKDSQQSLMTVERRIA